MTKKTVDIIDMCATHFRGDEFMKLDPFAGALWKEKLSDRHPDGSVTVTLSTGRKVTVNSRLLGLLRLLADELARTETGIH